MSSKKRRLVRDVEHGNRSEVAQPVIDYRALYEDALARIVLLEEKVAQSTDSFCRLAVMLRQVREHPRTTADIIYELNRAMSLLRENIASLTVLRNQVEEVHDQVERHRERVDDSENCNNPGDVEETDAS